jgi:hypothetical protein
MHPCPTIAAITCSCNDAVLNPVAVVDPCFRRDDGRSTRRPFNNIGVHPNRRSSESDNA